jgi:hypothetical protein
MSREFFSNVSRGLCRPEPDRTEMQGALATTDFQIDLAAIDRQCRAESGNLNKFGPNTFTTKTRIQHLR